MQDGLSDRHGPPNSSLTENGKPQIICIILVLKIRQNNCFEAKQRLVMHDESSPNPVLTAILRPCYIVPCLTLSDPPFEANRFKIEGGCARRTISNIVPGPFSFARGEKGTITWAHNKV